MLPQEFQYCDGRNELSFLQPCHRFFNRIVMRRWRRPFHMNRIGRHDDAGISLEAGKLLLQELVNRRRKPSPPFGGELGGKSEASNVLSEIVN